MASLPEEQVIENPTFLEHVRHFFEPVDIEHMWKVARMDLASYEGVKAKAVQIYFQTESGEMPPEPGRRWSEARVRTFRNWIRNKHPMGVAPLEVAPAAAEKNLMAAGSVRRNAASLTREERERERLAFAFRSIMERSPDHPQSYFALAGIHWFPEPIRCAHHEMRYNPWHRVYIDRFEAGLRSVPGCENITLPYWDILAPIPEWLFEPPFDSYVLQASADVQYPAGTATRRFPKAQIERNLADRRVPFQIRRAMNEPTWEAFTQVIEGAHDDGHVSCGPALQTPDIASFDPLFWFFHCNWERYWWAWQRRYDARELTTFRKTLSDPADTTWLDEPGFNDLEPFGVTSDQTIASDGYSYEDDAAELFEPAAFVKSGHVALDQAFSLRLDPWLSIRVKDIARLHIPGSFVVHLLADGQDVAQRAFFQSTRPERCATCNGRPLVSLDFVVPREEVVGKRLEVTIETLMEDRVSPLVPLSQAGSPTINVRELLVPE